MKTQLKKFLEDTELFVLDMDGTFFLEQDVIDGALDFINTVNRKGKNLCFLPIIPPRLRKIIWKNWKRRVAL